MSYKIEAVVKFNDGEALVLNEQPVIKYEKYGNYLFGLDQYGIFAGSYCYDSPSSSWVAFAGRKFQIPMVDGSFIEAHGQWWDGGESAFSETLGSKIINVTACTKQELENCYVFCGYKAVETEYEKLRNTYTGKVFGYWEYDAIIKGLEKPRRKDMEVQQ